VLERCNRQVPVRLLRPLEDAQRVPRAV